MLYTQALGARAHGLCRDDSFACRHRSFHAQKACIRQAAAIPHIKGQAYRSTLPAVRPTEGGCLGTREHKTVHRHACRTPHQDTRRSAGRPAITGTNSA